MCSIGEDDFGDEGGLHAMEPEKDKNVDISDKQGMCNKCRQTCAVFKLNFREPECRECFLVYARHKFRAALASSKILPRDANVLLFFDGSAEAVVLLDMLYHAQTQNTFKRLHCFVRVVYIDESQMQQLGAMSTNNCESILKMKDFLSHYKFFESYVLSIGYLPQETHISLYNLNKPELYLDRDLKQELEFFDRFKEMTSLTSRQDFLKHHRSRILEAAAIHFGCGFVFLPDISTNLAAQLLSAVALGRGGSAALDVALVDNRFINGIQLVRPLRDLNDLEVKLYLLAQQLLTPTRQKYGSTQGTSASLQNITKSFVENLQQNFSATVSTIFRTGDKIAANNENNNFEKNVDGKMLPLLTCAFCHSSLDYAVSTTLLAIEFSRLVSEAGATIDKCPNLEKTACSNLQGATDMERSRLCHACRNLKNDCSSNNSILSLT